MPFRRSHHKSRNGCSECKKRHIKCDEALPSCKFCTARNLECRYGYSSVETTSPSSLSPVSRSEPMNLADQRGLQIERRLLEADLLNHFYTNHILSLEDGNSRLSGFDLRCAKIAIKYPFSLDSLLAFTALHRAYIESNQRQHWLRIAWEYSEKACAGLSEAIGRITAATAPPALICSIYTATFALAQHRFSVPSSYLEAALRFTKLLRGCDELFARAEFAIGKHPLAGPEDAERNCDRSRRKYKTASTLDRLATQILIKLQTSPTYASRPDTNVYLLTIQFLIDGLQEELNGAQKPASFFKWPLNFQESFPQLLQAHDFTARLIFLLFPLGLYTCREVWFLGDLGENLARELFSSRDEVPSEWQEIYDQIVANFND